MQSTYYNQAELSELNTKINNRFIRNVYKPPKQSSSQPPPPQQQRLLNSSEFMEHARPMVMMDAEEEVVVDIPPPDVMMPTHARATPSPYYCPSLDCRHVATHTTTCPVCQKLYKGYDAVYIAIIVALMIVIIFLIKKMFTNLKEK